MVCSCKFEQFPELVLGEYEVVSVIKPVVAESFLHKYCDGLVNRNIGEQSSYIIGYQYVININRGVSDILVDLKISLMVNALVDRGFSFSSRHFVRGWL